MSDFSFISSSNSRGVYFACTIFHEDKVLVTTEEFPPVVEVDDTYPASVNNDFHWLMKVCRYFFLSISPVFVIWIHRLLDRLHLERRQNSATGYGAQFELGQRPLPHQTASSGRPATSKFKVSHFSSKNNRTNRFSHRFIIRVEPFLCAIFNRNVFIGTQSALGLQDLGQLHYQPLKDSQGTLVISTTCHLSNVKAIPSSLNFKWLPLSKLQRRIVTHEESTAGDLLLASLQVRSRWKNQMNLSGLRPPRKGDGSITSSLRATSSATKTAEC